MSEDQTFKGRFSYADDHCLEAALDGFVADLSDSLVRFDELKIEGLEIAVDVLVSAPASMYGETITALRALGVHAASGSIKTAFHVGGRAARNASRETVENGRRRSSSGLPARHRRWEVMRAARSGDAEALRRLHEAGVSLAQTYPAYRGWSTLHLAAHAGAVEAVEVLLGANADPALVSSEALTPLAVATDGEVAKLLLAGSTQHDQQVKAEAAIAAVCARGHADVVLVLVEAGAQVPAYACKGLAMSCARRGQLSTLIALVRQDARFEQILSDPEVMAAVITADDCVLLDYLLERGAKLPDAFLTDVVKAGALALLEGTLRNPEVVARCGTSAHGNDAMCVAAIAGKLDSMQVLARHGVPIHPQEPGPTSPIHYAARSQSNQAHACVTWLVEQGVSIHSRNADGQTVLAYAGERRGAETAAFLVQLGADASEITPGMLGKSGYATFRRLVEKAV